MDEEQQIEEMARTLNRASGLDDIPAWYSDFIPDAKALYDAGYRKITTAFWVTTLYSRADQLNAYSHTCSKCNYYYKDIRPIGYNYCPNCGAATKETNNG